MCARHVSEAVDVAEADDIAEAVDVAARHNVAASGDATKTDRVDPMPVVGSVGVSMSWSRT
jgi:hypothetical protein